MNKKVVVVCRGNIARSPFAEAILKQELNNRDLSDRYDVTSRGVQGTVIDSQPVKFPNITYYDQLYNSAKPALEKFGVDLSKHHSAPIDHNLAVSADLLLALDQKTANGLRTLFPEQAHKVHLLSDFADVADDIDDPEQASDQTRQTQIYFELHDALVAGLPKLLTQLES